MKRIAIVLAVTVAACDQHGRSMPAARARSYECDDGMPAGDFVPVTYTWMRGSNGPTELLPTAVPAFEQSPRFNRYEVIDTWRLALAAGYGMKKFGLLVGDVCTAAFADEVMLSRDFEGRPFRRLHAPSTIPFPEHDTCCRIENLFVAVAWHHRVAGSCVDGRFVPRSSLADAAPRAS